MDNFNGPVGYQFDEESMIKDFLEKGFDYVMSNMGKHPTFFLSFAFTLLGFSALKMWIILR